MLLFEFCISSRSFLGFDNIFFSNANYFMKLENRFDALCNAIREAEQFMTGSGTAPSESVASMIRHYTMFRYSLEVFKDLYQQHYIPAARTASNNLREAYETSMFKNEVLFTESYFNKPIQEKLQEGYVSMYHRIESLVAHLDSHFQGKTYGGLLSDPSRQAEGSVYKILKKWGLSKELLYKAESSSKPPPNYCINRLRMISNGIKHSGAVVENSSAYAPLANMPVDGENHYELQENAFFNDVATVNFYCHLLFYLTFSLSLQREIESLIDTLRQLTEVAVEDEIELQQAIQQAAENEMQIGLYVQAICSDNERDFMERLIAFGGAQKSPLVEPDELFVWLPHQS